MTADLLVEALKTLISRSDESPRVIAKYGSAGSLHKMQIHEVELSDDGEIVIVVE